MLENLRKLFAQLSRQYASDALARKAVHQVIATAIKHSADKVIISLSGEQKTNESSQPVCTKVQFRLSGGQESKVEIPVDVASILGVLFASGELIEQSERNVRAVVRVEFRTLRVDAEAVLVADPQVPAEAVLTSSALLGRFRSLELSSFDVGFPLNEEPEVGAQSFSRVPLVDLRSNVVRDGEVVFRNQRPAPQATSEQGKTGPDLERLDLGDAEIADSAERETLLLIEDDADQRAILRRVFEREGYAVEVAEDGIDGLVTASRVIPDVVIVDFMMPEIDGGETIRRLRANPLTAKIPVVVLTAYPSSEVEFGMLQAGADDFCPKSISKRVLLKRIERLIHGQA